MRAPSLQSPHPLWSIRTAGRRTADNAGGMPTIGQAGAADVQQRRRMDGGGDAQDDDILESYCSRAGGSRS